LCCEGEKKNPQLMGERQETKRPVKLKVDPVKVWGSKGFFGQGRTAQEKTPSKARREEQEKCRSGSMWEINNHF